MESQSNHPYISKVEPGIGIALSAAVLLAGASAQLVRNRPDYAEAFAPGWLPLAASALAVAGIVIVLNHSVHLPRLRRALIWGSLLLMAWAANGLPIDLLRVAGLIPLSVDWPGLATRALALAAAIVLARMALLDSSAPSSTRRSWYGYAAFFLALPYPVVRTVWALGGTLGLAWPGAAGQGFAPWLASIPWLLAGALSLLLASKPTRIPRRLLLAGGWSATAIVAMIGPAACWSLVTNSMGGESGLEGIATWVPCLFYGSWFLWAIAAGAATRSYQVRTTARPMPSQA